MSLSSVTAYISTGRLRRNAARLQKLASPAQVMAVIKADAYGHGLKRAADIFADCGIQMMAVARTSEAIDLRTQGFQEDILVLGAPLPGEWRSYTDYDLHATIPTKQHALELVEHKSLPRPIPSHIKIDTGMGRLGMDPGELTGVLDSLHKSTNATIAGIWTHLARAASTTDKGQSFTQRQLQMFRAAVDPVSGQAPLLHVANSTAIIRKLANELSDQPMVARAGLALFGLAETPDLTRQARLEPALRMIAPITQIKTVKAGTFISYGGTWQASEDSVIATVGAGYADGYPRLLSNRATVRIRNAQYPVVGNICMDMFMVNLGSPGSESKFIGRGDPVVLIGPNGPTAYDVAAWAETIPYEICSRIGRRVRKEYVTEFDNNVNI